jgi:hypothetical protein
MGWLRSIASISTWRTPPGLPPRVTRRWHSVLTKTLIHPKTIATANTIFSPAPAEVAWARTIMAAHAQAMAAGRGVVLVEGKLIENLHVEEARRIVTLADAIAEAVELCQHQPI